MTRTPHARTGVLLGRTSRIHLPQSYLPVCLLPNGLPAVGNLFSFLTSNCGSIRSTVLDFSSWINDLGQRRVPSVEVGLIAGSSSCRSIQPFFERVSLKRDALIFLRGHAAARGKSFGETLVGLFSSTGPEVSSLVGLSPCGARGPRIRDFSSS